MLQVLLVKHKFGEGIARGKAFMMFSCFMDFKLLVNLYLTRLGICNRRLWFVDFGLLRYNKCFKFSHVLGKRIVINLILYLFPILII